MRLNHSFREPDVFTPVEIPPADRLAKELTAFALGESGTKAMHRFFHTVHFFVIHANAGSPYLGKRPPSNLALTNLDRWILARTQRVVISLRKIRQRGKEEREFRRISDLIHDVSRRYVRESRPRFVRAVSEADQRAAFTTLHEVLLILIRLLYPLMKETMRGLYENLGRSLPADNCPSLTSYPRQQKAMMDRDILRGMHVARIAVRRAKALRQEGRLSLKQPLPGLRLCPKDVETSWRLLANEAYILAQSNVQRLILEPPQRIVPDRYELVFETTLEEERTDERVVRDLTRRVQQLRREAGLVLDEPIEVEWDAGGSIPRAVDRGSDLFRQRTCCVQLRRTGLERVVAETTFELEGRRVRLRIARAASVEQE